MHTSLKGMLSALFRSFGANREKISMVRRKSDIFDRPPRVAFRFLRGKATLIRPHVAELIHRAVSVVPENPRCLGEIISSKSDEWAFPTKSALSSRDDAESDLFLGDGGGVSPDGGVRDRRRARGLFLVGIRGEGVRRLAGERCLEIRRLDRRGVGARRPCVGARGRRPCGVGARRPGVGDGRRPGGVRGRRCFGRIAALIRCFLLLLDRSTRRGGGRSKSSR